MKTAMYRAKRVDPGGHVYFAADADDAMERLSFSTRLRQAVENENWVLHYQPVVDLADRRVIGAEALIRWKDANGGIVPPGRGVVNAPPARCPESSIATRTIAADASAVRHHGPPRP